MEQDRIQDEIIDEFSVYEDWMDRYEYLIEMGDSLPMIDPAHRTPKYQIEGCQSRVWVDSWLDADGKVRFSADSDAIITKGIAALLIRALDGRTPREIAGLDLYFIDRVGLRENLSPTRANGLAAMVERMRAYAEAFAES